MRHDPREAGGLHCAEQLIAPRSIAWLALGHNSFFNTPVKRSAERPLLSPQIDGVPIDDVSLYRIDHFYRRWLPRPGGTYSQTGTLSDGAQCFHAENAHLSDNV